MTSSKALAPGTQLLSDQNTYTIVRTIGSGGFGITYAASVPARIGNIRTSVTVAIKEHFPAADCERDPDSHSLTCGPTASGRVGMSLNDFFDEAQCLQRIAGLHPNIVTVNEVFRANNTAYYVMEYINGISLKEYVATKGGLSLKETVEIMLPVVSAVATLHQNRFTHLDIKPSNIMLANSEDGTIRPVLIDFGLAKHYNSDGSATATVSLTGFSEGYAPVEQYSGITKFSPAVDVYSLGATILFCLTGKTPPRSVEMTPESLRALLPAGIPPEFYRILSIATAFQASDRFPNARQLSIELNAIAGTGATPPAAPVADGVPLQTPKPMPAPADDRTIISSPRVSAPLPYYPPKSTEEALPPADPYSRKKIKQATPIWLWAAIAILSVALCVAGYLIYDNNRSRTVYAPSIEDNYDDSDSYSSRKRQKTKTLADNEDYREESPAEEAEEAVLDDGSVTPDLGFHFLSGPVKSCKNAAGINIPFNRSGFWTGTYNDFLGPREFFRDDYGRIVRETYDSEKYGQGEMTYTWNGNHVSTMVDENRNQAVYFTYDSDGNLTTQLIYNDGKETLFEYSNYRRDSHGNWTSRSFVRTTVEDGETKTLKGTQKRTITYY